MRNSRAGFSHLSNNFWPRYLHKFDILVCEIILPVNKESIDGIEWFQIFANCLLKFS